MKDKQKEIEELANLIIAKYNDEIRKKTVKELLTAQFKEYKECEKLVLEARNNNKNDDYYKGFSVSTTNQRMYLKELARQYGVEVESE